MSTLHLDAEALHSFAKRGIVQAATNRRHRATCPLCRRRLTLTPCQCLHDDRIPIVATFPRHDSLTFPEQQPSHRFGSFLIRERQQGEHLDAPRRAHALRVSFVFSIVSQQRNSLTSHSQFD